MTELADWEREPSAWPADATEWMAKAIGHPIAPEAHRELERLADEFRWGQAFEGRRKPQNICELSLLPGYAEKRYLLTQVAKAARFGDDEKIEDALRELDGPTLKLLNDEIDKLGGDANSALALLAGPTFGAELGGPARAQLVNAALTVSRGFQRRGPEPHHARLDAVRGLAELYQRLTGQTPGCSHYKSEKPGPFERFCRTFFWAVGDRVRGVEEACPPWLSGTSEGLDDVIRKVVSSWGISRKGRENYPGPPPD